MSRRKKRAAKKKLRQNQAGKRSPSISVCMIVKNEENFLPKCLESIRDIADEIIVVDTGSTDRSIEIARSYGAKVYQYPWENDFSRHRNQSLDRATGDWIFVIDADEIIPRKEINKLRKAVETPWADAYRMTTRNYKPTPNQMNTRKTTGEYEEEQGYQYWVPSTKIRLFRRNPRIRFRGAVHELIEPSIREIGLKIKDLKIPILHFGDVQKVRDERRYLEIAKAKVARSPNSPQAHFELALIQANSNQLVEGLDTINRAIRLMEQGQNEEYLDPKVLYTLKGNILTNIGQYKDAIKSYGKALEIFPEFIEAINNIGICYENLGSFEQAEKWFTRAVSISKDADLPRKNLERIHKKKENSKTLSVCMIVRDEADRIKTAIESVVSFADEIVVVDTGSKDKTVEIARELGAKVGHFEWCDDFSAARNASLDLATGDWIMWLDADDFVPPTEWRKLQDLKMLAPNQAFMFKLKSQGTENGVCWQLRMFPRDRSIRFSCPVHEQVTPSIMALNIPIKKAPVTIIHTGYSDEKTIEKKRKRNLSILERGLAKNPSDAMIRFHLGYTYFSVGNYEQAIANLEKVVIDDKFKKNFLGGQSAALTYLGKSYLEVNRVDEAVNTLESALAYDKDSALARLYLATCYNRLDRPEEALDVLSKINTSHLVSMIPVDPKNFEYSLELEKALALEKIGDFEEAIYACSRALNLCPSLQQAHIVLSRLFRAIESDKSAVDVLSRISESEFVSAEVLYHYGNALVREGSIQKAEEAYRRALSTDGNHVNARRALALILRHKGDYEGAKKILQEALEANCTSLDLLSDLLDILFILQEWTTILQLPVSKETVPTRLAARIIGGLDDGMEYDILAFFNYLDGDINDLDNTGVNAIWDLSQKLQDPQRFHLAVSCFWIEPSLAEAAEAAVEGYLLRGKVDMAIQVAEKHITCAPSNPKGLELLSRCYEQLGAPELATESCYRTNKFTRPQNTTGLVQIDPILSNFDSKNQ